MRLHSTPGPREAHLGRAELCCIIDDKEGAVRSYERYLALVREDAEPSVVAEACLTYGELLFDLSREQEALEQLTTFHRTQAVRLVPTFMVGRAYIYLGDIG